MFIILLQNLITVGHFESYAGLMTDFIGKFAKNQVQKSLLPYFAAIGRVEFYKRENHHECNADSDVGGLLLVTNLKLLIFVTEFRSFNVRAGR